jgi:hypothetical protein
VIFVDLDRNQGTGCNGDEVLFQATGMPTGQQEVFEVFSCQSGQFTRVQPATFAAAFDTPSRVVVFRLSARVLGTNRFQALAMTLWEPDDQSSYRDFAPDGSYLVYTVPQIPCNQFIRPAPEASWSTAVTSRGPQFRYSRLGVERVPARAVVTIRVRGASATVRATTGGVAVSGRFRRFLVPPRSVVAVTIRAEGCSRTVRFRVLGSGRLRQI